MEKLKNNLIYYFQFFNINFEIPFKILVIVFYWSNDLICFIFIIKPSNKYKYTFISFAVSKFSLITYLIVFELLINKAHPIKTKLPPFDSKMISFHMNKKKPITTDLVKPINQSVFKGFSNQKSIKSYWQPIKKTNDLFKETHQPSNKCN